jgi:hypothetical protein
VNFRNQRATRIAFFGTLCVLLLGAIWTRGERVLGNDSYAYLERAKQFRQSFPTHFGDWWPYGFPLLGTAVSLTGLSSYLSLVAVSAAAIFGVVVSFWHFVPGRENKNCVAIFVLLAALCAPVCPLTLVGILSEPLFSACLFGLAFALSCWPSRSAIVLSMVLGTLAFTVRYVGALTYGLIAIHALLLWETLAATKRRLFFFSLYGAALAVAAFCCYLNYRHFGRISGPQPVGREQFSSWPVQLAAFGWSPVSAFISGGILKALGGIAAVQALIAGFTSVLIGAFFLLRSWLRPATPAVRPLVLIVAAYSVGIVTLRATTPFDDLHSARTFLPILFPLAYMTLVQVHQRWHRLTILICSVLVVGEIALALRGMSADVKPAIDKGHEALGRVLRPNQTVAINGKATSVAAYFPNRFYPIAQADEGLTVFWEPTEKWIPSATDYTLIVLWPPEEGSDQLRNWSALISPKIADGLVILVGRDDAFILLRSADTCVDSH